MRIGIDIDGVLTNIEQFSLNYLTKYCVENNIKYNIDKSSYYLRESFNITEEQENAFWTQYLQFYAINEKARPLASEVIKKLKEDGNEIYIITARWGSNREDEIGHTMREIVKKWLIENEIIYDELIFSKEDNEQKVNEIKEYKIDLMIEDNPNNINGLSSIVPVICYDTRYNQECINDNIIRCYTWYDIYTKIKEIDIK